MASSTRACSTPMQNPRCLIPLPLKRSWIDEFNSPARTSRKRKASITNLEPPLRPNVIGHRAPYPHNLPHGLVDGCNICPKTSRRIECSNCGVVHYCCSDHLVLDYPAHQIICKKIQRHKNFVAEFRDAIPSDDEDDNTPLRTFGGNYTLREAAEKFMYSRRDLVLDMVQLNTKAAVEQALDYTFDMLKLDPEDTVGIRCMAPWLFLRLKRDQECYDYCKWWVTEGTHKEHAWDSEDLPLCGEDPLESADVFERIRDYGADPPRRSDLSFLLAVLLLKIRMLSDVKFLRDQKGRDFALWSTSSIVFEDIWDDREREGYLPLIKELENQVGRLFRAVGRANKHFWLSFIQPSAHLAATPLSHGLGDEAEMQVKLQECYNAWMETLGADGYILELMGRIDARWFRMNEVNGHSLHLRQCEFSVQYIAC